MNRNKLKQIIEVLVENVLREQEDKPATEDTPDAGGLDLGGDTSSEGDAGLDLGGDSTEMPTGDELETPGAGEDPGLDLGGDSSGGGLSSFGGGGFSGGSSSSSDSSDGGEDKSAEPAAETPEQMTQDAVPEDPIKSTIDMAIHLSGLTGRSQDITNAIKHNIQNYFNEPEDAVEIVQGLWDTNNPKLRSVAYKILMFIKGE